MVVYCDKSRLTGWGDSGAPSYHTQFIAIAGIVIFKSTDVDKLPLTTTKRGIDANSELFLLIRKYMIEGLKLFTGYTNKWKNDVARGKENIERTSSYEPIEIVKKIKNTIPESRWKNVGSQASARRYIPELPVPETTAAPSEKTIRYKKPASEISAVSEYLFENPDYSPADVGVGAFEEIFKISQE